MLLLLVVVAVVVVVVVVVVVAVLALSFAFLSLSFSFLTFALLVLDEVDVLVDVADGLTRERRVAVGQELVDHLTYFWPSMMWSNLQQYPKDPAVLKTLQDSELLRRSLFTTPPQIYYAANPSLRGAMPVIPMENGVRTRRSP